MAEKRGTKALELWCKKMTEGYPGVKVENMTTSWRDGLAFCAIIHRFKPELIDFSKLNKDDVFYNNELAFTVAEKYLGIPALLEPEDMVEYDVPDRLSILTYLSQFYKAFVTSQVTSAARLVPKRPANSSDRAGSTSPASTSPPAKMAIKSAAVAVAPRREPCARCGNLVYIAERLTVGKLLYHRTCFRCARCNSQLTLANCYETETPNQFCCETCPDEEATPTPPTAEKSALARSLSDEEKRQLRDDYSANFEKVMETTATSEYALARSRFLSADLGDLSDGESPPELPKTKPPDISPSNSDSMYSAVSHESDVSKEVERTKSVSAKKRSPDRLSSSNSKFSELRKSAKDRDEVSRYAVASITKEKEPSVTPRMSSNVRKDTKINEDILRIPAAMPSTVKNLHLATSPSSETLPNLATSPNSSAASSLVKNRMKLFEEKSDSGKRPLADVSVVVSSPEKRVSKSSLQAQSLNLLLRKQIELKEGKITPQSLIAGRSQKTPGAEKVEDRNEIAALVSPPKEMEKREVTAGVTPSGLGKSLSRRQSPLDGGDRSKVPESDESPTTAKQKSPIFTTKTFLGKNWKENRRHRSLESVNSEVPPIRRMLSSSDLRKAQPLTPSRRVASAGKIDRMDHHPMRSIENLSTASRKVDSSTTVSALKDKFECLVESRPQTPHHHGSHSIVEGRVEDAPAQAEEDLENRSVVSENDAVHGEVLRHGHLIIDADSYVAGESHEERSDVVACSSEDPITIDLTESPTDGAGSAQMLPKDPISDDSVIVISDSSSSVQYPEDLNPFGEDEEGETVEGGARDNLNPFESDVDVKPKPAVRKKISLLLDPNFYEGDTPEYVGHVRLQRISVNPFEDEDDNEDAEVEVKSNAAATGIPKKVISAPRISLNPFWSDADEDESEYDEEEGRLKPVPTPRKLRNSGASVATPEPKPRKSNHSLGGIASFGSNSSLSSSQSGGQSLRKKKPAPRPPILVAEAQNLSANESSLTSSPSTSVSHSPRLPTKSRKAKKAPLPPSSTPYLSKDSLPTTIIDHASPALDVSPIFDSAPIKAGLEGDDVKETSASEWTNEKVAKDRVNENRRSQLFNSNSVHIIPPSPPPSNNDHDYQDYVPNKSTYGKWKRKKGPAPSRPVPQRRMIKALPVAEFRKELDLIELQKQGLEKQGVRLEQIIRDRCEGPDRDLSEVCDEDTVPIDVEDLILQLFEVVNEKNELSRREAELMYLQRQQRLEEEQAEVEYQIRCLMMQPEATKTDSDKAREEELIQRLVEIVERRNEIVECLEMDRQREAEEDDSISSSMNSYASRREEQSSGVDQHIESELKSPKETLSKKEKSKKVKKDKKKKNKSEVLDADKDVDESETTSVASFKEKKKKKFALF